MIGFHPYLAHIISFERKVFLLVIAKYTKLGMFISVFLKVGRYKQLIFSEENCTYSDFWRLVHFYDKNLYK